MIHQWLFKRRVLKSLKEKIWLLKIDIAYNKNGLEVCKGLLEQQVAQVVLLAGEDEKTQALKKKIEENVESLTKTKDQLQLFLNEFTGQHDQLVQKFKFIQERV